MGARQRRHRGDHEGFILNHLIDELLPAKGNGLRWANSDPVTGQAAWFDLRVRIERVDSGAPRHSEPSFPPVNSPVPRAPRDVRRKTEP